MFKYFKHLETETAAGIEPSSNKQEHDSHSCQLQLLLALIPQHPDKTGEDARIAIASSGLPLCNTGIRPLAVFQKAALE